MSKLTEQRLRRYEVCEAVHAWMQANGVKMEDCYVEGDAAWLIAQQTPPTAPRGVKWYHMACKELIIRHTPKGYVPRQDHSEDVVVVGVGEDARYYEVTVSINPVLSAFPLRNVGGIQVQVTPALEKALDAKAERAKGYAKAEVIDEVWKRTKDDWYSSFGEQCYTELGDYVAKESARQHYADAGYHWVCMQYKLYLDGTSRVSAYGDDDYCQIWEAPPESKEALQDAWELLLAQDFVGRDDVSGLCGSVAGIEFDN